MVRVGPAVDEVGAAPRKRAPGGGRKRTFDNDVVLERAVEVFWENGFRDTTTRQLEGALGLTASSIYNAFGSKFGLLEAAIPTYLARIERDLLTPLRSAKDPLEGLEEFVHLAAIGLDGAHRWGCLIVGLLTENAGREEVLVRYTDDYFNASRHELTVALERAAGRGMIEPDTIGQRVEVLLAAVLGINTAARGRMGDDIVEAMARAIQAEIRAWRVTPSSAIVPRST